MVIHLNGRMLTFVGVEGSIASNELAPQRVSTRTRPLGNDAAWEAATVTDERGPTIPDHRSSVANHLRLRRTLMMLGRFAEDGFGSRNVMPGSQPEVDCRPPGQQDDIDPLTSLILARLLTATRFSKPEGTTWPPAKRWLKFGPECKPETGHFPGQ